MEYHTHKYTFVSRKLSNNTHILEFKGTIDDPFAVYSSYSKLIRILERQGEYKSDTNLFHEFDLQRTKCYFALKSRYLRSMNNGELPDCLFGHQVISWNEVGYELSAFIKGFLGYHIVLIGNDEDQVRPFACVTLSTDKSAQFIRLKNKPRAIARLRGNKSFMDAVERWRETLWCPPHGSLVSKGLF